MRVKARHPVTGNILGGYKLGRGNVHGVKPEMWLIQFDDGGKGWVHPKFVFAQPDGPEPDRERPQARLV